MSSPVATQMTRREVGHEVRLHQLQCERFISRLDPNMSLEEKVEAMLEFNSTNLAALRFNSIDLSPIFSLESEALMRRRSVQRPSESTSEAAFVGPFANILPNAGGALLYLRQAISNAASSVTSALQSAIDSISEHPGDRDDQADAALDTLRAVVKRAPADSPKASIKRDFLAEVELMKLDKLSEGACDAFAEAMICIWENAENVNDAIYRSEDLNQLAPLFQGAYRRFSRYVEKPPVFGDDDETGVLYHGPHPQRRKRKHLVIADDPDDDSNVDSGEENGSCSQTASENKIDDLVDTDEE